MSDYVRPVGQPWPLVDLPDTSTPVYAAFLTGLDTAAADLGGASGRVKALETGKDVALVPTAKSANYTAVSGDLVLMDASGGARTVTLPAATAGRKLAVKKIDTGTNLVTMAAVGSDTIGAQGAVTLALRLSDEGRTLVAQAGNWVVASGVTTLPSLDARYDAIGAAATETTRAQAAEATLTAGVSSNTTAITGLKLTPTAVKTADYTAVASDLVRVSTTSGARTVTLPAAAAGVVIAVKMTAQTGSNGVTITPTGSDTIDGGASLRIGTLNDARTLLGSAGGWTVSNGSSAVPTTVPTHAGTVTRTGTYDPAKAVYLPAAASTAQFFPKLRAALGRARSGTGLARLTFVGDSLTAGYGVTPGQQDYSTRIAQHFAALGYPVGELVGLCGSTPTVDSRVTLGGWAAVSGSTGLVTGAGDLLYTSRVTGTVVEILYSAGGSTFTYQIDGATAVTVPSSTANLAMITVTGLANTVHTVKVNSPSGGAFIAALGVRSATGVVIHSSGISGTTTSDWGSTGAYYTGVNVPLAASPHAVFVTLGRNDVSAGASAAAIATNLTTIVAAITAASAAPFLCAPHMLSGYAIPPFFDVSDSSGAPVLDLVDRIPDAAGELLLFTDNIHCNPAGYSVMAQAFCDALGATPTDQSQSDLRYAQLANNLSDLPSAATARTSLGLGGAATRAVGTTTGTVAAGDDSRITGAAQATNNLSDLASASTARTNLGLVGTGDLPEVAASVAVTAANLLGMTTRFNTTSGAITQPFPAAAPGGIIAVGWNLGANSFTFTAATRSDSATTTSGSATVTDTSIVAADLGRSVVGPGVPFGSYVGTVTAGASFLLSSSSTSQVNALATASGTVTLLISDTFGSSGRTSVKTTTVGEVRTWHCTTAGRWRETTRVVPDAALLPPRLPTVVGLPAVVGTYTLGVNTPARTTTGTSRVPLMLGVTGSNVRLVYDNWQIGSTLLDQDNTAAITIKASIEAGATIIPVTFGGKLSVAIDGGGFVVSDPLAIDVTAGNVLYVRTFITPTTNWYHNRYSYASSGSGGWTVTSDLTPAGSAAISDASITPLFGPSMVTVEPTGATAIGAQIFGDSIGAGYADGVASPSFQGINTVNINLGGGGLFGRAFNGIGGLVNSGVAGDTAAQFRTVAGHFRRATFTGCCPIMICQYGRNDLSGASTLAQLQGNLIWIWQFGFNRGQRVYQTTLTPRTTSTDGWVTTGNQTLATGANETVRTSFNDWLRDGAPVDTSANPVAIGTTSAVRAGQVGHPLTGYLEVADRVETARNSGVWKIMLNSRSVTDAVTTAGGGSITSATAAYTSADLGRRILVTGAGASGALYAGTITNISSATSVQVNPNPSTAVTSGSMTLGDSYTGDGVHPDAYGASQAALAIPAASL